MIVRDPVLGSGVRARVVGALARCGATREDAEDAFQDALVALLSRPSTARDVASAEAWLLTVARRRLVDRYRHDTRRLAAHRSAVAQLRSPTSLHMGTLPDLDGVSAHLSERLRQTLRLLAEGSDARAIAAELGISRWAAYKRIQRIRTYIRRHAPQGPLNPG